MNRLDADRLAARIADKVVRDGDCLVWTGATTAGSPVMKVDGVVATVARVVWALERYDDCPQKLHHSCGNRLCVNGAHLVDAAHIVEVEPDTVVDWSFADTPLFDRLRRACGRFAEAYGWDADDVFQEACVWLAAHPGGVVADAVRAGAAVARRRMFEGEPVEFAGLFREGDS